MLSMESPVFLMNHNLFNQRLGAEIRYLVVKYPRIRKTTINPKAKGLLNDTETQIDTEMVNKDDETTKTSLFSRILDTISGIFTPLLSAITAAAMIKTLLVILDLFKLIDKSGGTYQVLTFAGDTAFYFMPVLVAFSASAKFKLNPYFGALMGILLIHPSFVAMVAEGEAVKLFGFIPVTLANYSATVIPIILIIWLASYVDRYVDKFCPEAVKFFLRPLVTFLIMIPLALVVDT